MMFFGLPIWREIREGKLAPYEVNFKTITNESQTIDDDTDLILIQARTAYDNFVTDSCDVLDKPDKYQSGILVPIPTMFC
eukprot:8797289-Ditylum_brightwellii.AAC.2